jgi:acetyl-CoA acetyltransferase
MANGVSGAAAIVGLGASEVGRVYGKTAGEFAADAVRAAVADAGLELGEVDGLITSNGISRSGPRPAAALGLRNLRLAYDIATAGATAAAAVQAASMAVASGMADTVVYVHSDQPLQGPGQGGGSVYETVARDRSPSGFEAMNASIGLAGATPFYALAARRHMERYGTTSEQLGAIAVSQRAWAAMNPLATMRAPITLADHQGSRWIAEPFHLLDCCLVSNGAVAVVITRAERAADLAQPPVYVWGWGQCHPGYAMSRGSEFGLVSGAAISGQAAFAIAGISREDIDVRELYDCYTYTALLTLEDYGFVPKGEGGPFVATGALGPGGSMPTNTGGGQLSSFYLWGATPLHEAVVQARGQGGGRQVPKHDFVLCSGNGGILEHHGTLILGAHPRK